MFAPSEVLHAIGSLDDHGQVVIRGYIEELDGKLRLAASRELDARGKVVRLKDAINHAIQNTRGLPPDCRVHLMDAVEGLTKP